MSIKRAHIPADGYAIIANHWLRDPRLSWKAKGLLAYIASHDKRYQLSAEQFLAEGREARDAVRSGLRELEEAGYLRRVEARDSDGRIVGTDYELTEPAPPPDGKPSAGKPVPGAELPEQGVSAAQSSAGKPVPGDLSLKKTTKETSSEEGAAPAPPAAEEVSTEAQPDTAQTIVRDFIDFCAGRDVRLTRSTIGRYGASIKSLLDQGFPPITIKHALSLMLARNKVGNVALLDSFVVEVQTAQRNRPTSPAAGPAQYRTAAEKGEDRRAEQAAVAKIADELAAAENIDPTDVVGNLEIGKRARKIYASQVTTCHPTGYSGTDDRDILDAQVVSEWRQHPPREVTAG